MSSEKTSHVVVSTPLRGSGAKWNMATVIHGEHEGKCVCILVEFADGWCVCDMGDDDPMEIIKIEDMRLWIPVRSVVCRDGKTFYDPLRTYMPFINEPSDEGKKRYHPNGRYEANSTPGTPCTCKETCPHDCNGGCGCEACSEAYGDFLSSQ